MITKQFFLVACSATVLNAGVANAGPCTTGQTIGVGPGTTGQITQENQRQEHAQPAVAEQPKSAGVASDGIAGGEQPEPSAKMTAKDQFPVASPGSEASAKMADQGC
jgi:hypothetical protein